VTDTTRTAPDGCFCGRVTDPACPLHSKLGNGDPKSKFEATPRRAVTDTRTPLDLDAIRRSYSAKPFGGGRPVLALCDEVERLRQVADAARAYRVDVDMTKRVASGESLDEFIEMWNSMDAGSGYLSLVAALDALDGP
jgi:hypothetical protein